MSRNTGEIFGSPRVSQTGQNRLTQGPCSEHEFKTTSIDVLLVKKTLDKVAFAHYNFN